MREQTRNVSSIRKRRQKRRDRQRKLALMGLSGVGILVILVLLVLILANKYYIDFTIPDDETITLQYGETYSAEDVKATYKGTIFQRKGTELKVTPDGTVDDKTFGTYEVKYTATHKKLTKTVRRTVIVEDKLAPVIKLVSDSGNYVSPGKKYEEEGYSAIDNYDGDITDKVVREEQDGVITYTVTDSNGNTATEKREIIYKDVVAPEIALKGDRKVRIPEGESFTDEGFTAEDDVDGDLTAQVKVDGSVDTSKIGDYALTYTVTDSSGNTGKVVRKVSVIDTVKPTLSLKGDSMIYVNLGEKYTEPGYTAEDNRDGDISSKVKVSGEPDVSKRGVYTVKYTVKDSSGNKATAKRTVLVYEKQSDAQTAAKDPGKKVVYLTFDDGPGPYTDKLLKVLEKYNVKATFFVTNQFPDYQDLIKKEHEKGHTVAIHSYSHTYEKIYKSQQAFFEDLEKMSDICYNQTGVRPTIIRFPGGSSNTISANYCKGIMTELAKSLEQVGYHYADWNVSSEDAGPARKADEVYKNVIEGIQRNNASVVLQHDIKEFSVNAVENIITWGLANGYTFLPMDESSPMAHHGINN